jgi:hypothetical protein
MNIQYQNYSLAPIELNLYRKFRKLTVDEIGSLEEVDQDHPIEDEGKKQNWLLGKKSFNEL